MAQSRTVTRLAGLELRVAPSAAASFLLTWGALTVAGVRLGGLSRRAAALGGLVAAAGHWDAILVHHLGHALAARSTGYPMTGVDFRGPLGVSLYPDDEPTLSAATHRHRALGGPLLSAVNGVIFGYLALLLRRRGGAPYRVAQFLLLRQPRGDRRGLAGAARPDRWRHAAPAARAGVGTPRQITYRRAGATSTPRPTRIAAEAMLARSSTSQSTPAACCIC